MLVLAILGWPFLLLVQIANFSASRLRKFTRDFGISNATLHDVHSDDICTFKWERFIIRESLVRYVFLFLPPTGLKPNQTVELSFMSSFSIPLSSSSTIHLLGWWCQNWEWTSHVQSLVSRLRPLKNALFTWIRGMLPMSHIADRLSRLQSK